MDNKIPKNDLTGQRFGKLTVLEYAGRDAHNNIMWKCKCDCGNTRKVQNGSLVHGKSKSCGCGKVKNRDLKGLVFGRLTALTYKGKDIRGCKLWECKCSCGNTITTKETNLINGRTKSCGCLRKDVNAERLKKHLEGQRFGDLTVLENIGTQNKRQYWKCKCDCGNIKIASSSALLSGNCKSCGCRKNRKGEDTK